LSLDSRPVEDVQFLPEAPEAAKDMGTHPGYTREQMNTYRNGSIEAANLAFPCEDAELRDAYLDAVAHDDDVLTQFVEQSELRQRIQESHSFEDLIKIWQWMCTEHDI